MSSLKNKKILVTGSSGFLGGFVMKKLSDIGVSKKNVYAPSSEDYDLRDRKACDRAVSGMNLVIHLAGTTGGIGYHRGHPADTFYDNAIMAINLIDSAYRAEVEKFVGIGSVCSYPKYTPVPFKEEDLWNGYPEETNASYGLAKKMMLVQSQAYNKQYGFNAVHLLMVNMYGPGDRFDLEGGHVIPAIIRKIYEAKRLGRNFIDVWGSGKVSREFLYVEDAAEGIVLAADRYNKPEPVNLGSGQTILIKNLAEKIAELMNFKGKLRWDTSKPDGQPKRMLDVSKAEREFGFKARTPFDVGLRRTIEWWESEGVKKYKMS